MKKLPVSDLKQLRQYLVGSAHTYILLSDLPATKVALQFEGLMQGQPIMWNACIKTMGHYALSHVVHNDPKQIINIELMDQNYQIEVVLNVKQVNQSILESTIVMINQYKRLSVGLHEYGARSKTE